MTRGPGSDPTRGGLALGLVVVLTVALTLLAHAALLLGRTEVWITRLEGRRLEARGHARASLASYHRGLDTLPATGAGQTAFGAVRVERLSAEVALVRALPGFGSPHDLTGTRAARILFAPDPMTRVLDRSVGVAAAGLTVASGAEFGPAADGRVCDGGLGPVAGFRYGALTPDSALLGLLSFADLVDRVPGGPRGTTGSPTAPPWLVTDTLHGVWAYPGQVVLADGALVEGWIWAMGDVVLQPGSEFRGFLDASGSVTVAASARLLTSPCAALAGLTRARELHRPWRIGPRAWPAP